MPDRREENAARTRAAIVSAAFDLFGRRGFREVAIDDICTAVGLSRGGFYHHFSNKEDCFEAVWIDLQEQFAAEAEAHFLDNEHLALPDRTTEGFLHLLEFWAEPRRRRINLLDSTTALGWERIRQLSGEHGTAEVAGLLGALGRTNDRLTARLVAAAIGEAVYLAGDPDDNSDPASIAQALTDLINGVPDLPPT